LTIVPVGGGAGLAATEIRFDPATRTATFVLPRNAPAGDYTGALRLPVPGGTRDFDLFVLLGDVNGDRAVNGSDFSLFAGSFGRTGLVPFSGTDFTGDGAVNGSDFAILAQGFGRSLPPRAGLVTSEPAAPAPAPASAPAPAPAPAPVSRRRVVRRAAPAPVEAPAIRRPTR
jgi:hypothetical protein